MTAKSPIPGRLVKGLFHRVLAAELTPALVDELAGVGLDVSLPAEESYPREVWHQAVDVSARGLFPAENHDESLRRLGRHVIVALDERKLMKGPWLSMARLMGPRRALRQAADFAATSSPVQLHLVEHGKRDFEVRVDEDRQPAFLAGVLEGLVMILGGESPQADVVSSGEGQAFFRLAWK